MSHARLKLSHHQMVSPGRTSGGHRSDQWRTADRNSLHLANRWLFVHEKGYSRWLACHILPFGRHFRHGHRLLDSIRSRQTSETMLYLTERKAFHRKSNRMRVNWKKDGQNTKSTVSGDAPLKCPLGSHIFSCLPRISSCDYASIPSKLHERCPRIHSNEKRIGGCSSHSLSLHFKDCFFLFIFISCNQETTRQNIHLQVFQRSSLGRSFVMYLPCSIFRQRPCSPRRRITVWSHVIRRNAYSWCYHCSCSTGSSLLRNCHRLVIFRRRLV